MIRSLVVKDAVKNNQLIQMTKLSVVLSARLERLRRVRGRWRRG